LTTDKNIDSMSFRKRGVILSANSPSSSSKTGQERKPLASGIRLSPLDGRLTTSTGTSSFDQLVAGAHAGLPLGTSLLIEESGTTDFGGVLLRYYAAEGLVQGHHLHVVGYSEAWKANLPGLAASDGSTRSKPADSGLHQEPMKIAWRYEALGSRKMPLRGELESDEREGIAV
jgi:elongator complex protein 4